MTPEKDPSEKLTMYKESKEERPIPGRQHCKPSAMLQFKF
jgi:hypothetical protein